LYDISLHEQCLESLGVSDLCQQRVYITTFSGDLIPARAQAGARKHRFIPIIKSEFASHHVLRGTNKWAIFWNELLDAKDAFCIDICASVM
jgi:hypothetical protein